MSQAHGQQGTHTLPPPAKPSPAPSFCVYGPSTVSNGPAVIPCGTDTCAQGAVPKGQVSSRQNDLAPPAPRHLTEDEVTEGQAQAGGPTMCETVRGQQGDRQGKGEGGSFLPGLTHPGTPGTHVLGADQPTKLSDTHKQSSQINHNVVIFLKKKHSIGKFCVFSLCVCAHGYACVCICVTCV